MTVHRGPRGLTRLLDALGEPTRRRVYEVVRRATGPMTRREVAESLGIGLRLAAFHLDKLVAEQLLAAHYARPSGRPGGPGAGRPAKRYVASPARFDITVPPRRYDIAAQIMLAAVTETPTEKLRAAARRHGAELARQRAAEPLQDVLAELGYEPSASRDALDLVNCPFRELAEQARQETCAMNQAFLSGLTSTLAPDRDAVLEPRPGVCCVRLRVRPAEGSEQAEAASAARVDGAGRGVTAEVSRSGG